jgi:hypothetical protein
LPNPPKWAKLKPGVSLTLDKSRGQRQYQPVENTIRAITLNRKNALFAGHDEGGRTWARIASLIETCKLNAIANSHPAHRRPHAMGLPKTVKMKPRRVSATAYNSPAANFSMMNFLKPGSQMQRLL